MDPVADAVGLPPMQAGFFGPHTRPLLGCYHPPVAGGEPSALGVLLCSPFGCEELSAHRSLRVLAQQLAAAGLPVLRFDMDGCGDSAGSDTDPSRVSSWIASIGAAVDALRRQSGCAQVALVGLRLGALLAAQVARSRAVLNADVAQLVAIAPVVSGRRYLRECLALGSMQGGAHALAAEQGLLESGGFVFTRGTREALGQLDLSQTHLGAVPSVHIFERAELPSAGAWIKRLQADAVPVAVESFEGYARLMDEPHRTEVPSALWQRVSELLIARAQALQLQGGAGLRARGASALRFGRAVGAWDALIEQPVQIPMGQSKSQTAQGDHLFGVLTRPASGVPVRRAVLVLNAGSNRRVGPSRLFLSLARRWAPKGVMVLRLDLCGLGDSPAAAGQPDNIVYSHRALAEVSQAVDWLLDNSGLQRCTLLGLCAGATHAFKAAAGLKGRQGAAVAQLVLINPLVFEPVPGQALDGSWSPHRQQALESALQSSLWDVQRWRRLLSGEFAPGHLWTLMQRYARLQWQRGPRRLARALHLPLRTRVGRVLDTLAAQGTYMDFVFAEDEPGLPMLREQGGHSYLRRMHEGWLHLHGVAQADHVFVNADARERLALTLDPLVLPPPG